MKKYFFKTVFLLFLSINYIHSQGYAGEDINSIQDFDDYSKETFGFSDDIPSSASLEKYVPLIGDQRQTGSCVAWSVAYYNLSTIYNSIFEITNWRDKYSHAFDPWFLYSTVNQLMNETTDCGQGVTIYDAYRFIKAFGGKKIMYPPYDTACNFSTNKSNYEIINRVSAPYKIKDFEVEHAREFDPYRYPLSQRQINMIKTEIAKYGFPVVVGFGNFGNTLDNVGSSGYWSPTYTPGDGNHAMTVVGYDDYKFGGAFRIVNSWGYDWGDGGYAWIPYNDFKKYAEVMYFTWINPSTIKRKNNYIREIDGYTRMNATSKKEPNRKIIYEGETSSDGKFNGYGIISFVDLDAHYAGWFTNGRLNGTFRVLTEDGFFQRVYQNGNYVSGEKLGFAENNDNLEQLELTNSYISKMFPSIRFKTNDSDADTEDGHTITEQ